MLHRDRQTRTQIHQLMDAGLIVLAFWLAHWIRNQVAAGVMIFGYRVLWDARNTFPSYDWLYLVLGFLAPLVLDAQGFYRRQNFVSRRTTIWILGKSCLILVLAVILILFIARISTPRGVIVFFAPLAFLLVYLKEELVRFGYKSEFGKNQFRKRFM
ncbi:MAG: sugar transferase, partial [Verrucomicrobiota bacterium]